MAVQKAVFQADFGDFDAAVVKADAGLRQLERTTNVVEGSFQKMTSAASSAIPPTTQLTTEYQKFDGVLSAAGVHIGPQVKGLEDIASAAGKTATEIGLLGTAGLIAGAAFTGWKIGTMIDEWTGLSKVFEKAAIDLGLFNDAAAETRGAQLDVINRAIAAGGAVSTYSEAIKFNTEQAKINAATAIDWKAKHADIYAEVLRVTDAKRAEIAIAVEAGAKEGELMLKYHLSAQALKILATQQREAVTASEAHAKAREAEIAAIDKTAAALAKERELRIIEQRNEAEAAADAVANAAKRQAAMNALTPMFSALVKGTADAKAETARLGEEERMLEADYQATVKAVEDNTAAHTAMGTAAGSATQIASAGYQQVQQQAALTLDNVRALAVQMRDEAAANAILHESWSWTQWGGPSSSQYARIAALPLPPGFQSGVTNFAGGLARVHQDELLVNLPSGTSVIPKGSGGGGTTVYNTFHLVDTESNLARRVSETILRTVRAGTQLGTT